MRSTWFLLLAAAGCKRGEEIVPLVTAIEASAPVRAEVAPAAGEGAVEVPVRLLNRYGAAVPGGEATIFVEGPTASTAEPSVAFDPTGYGVVQVLTTGPERFTVGIASTADADLELGDPAPCASVAGPLQGFDLRSSWPAPAEGILRAAALLDGVALATEFEVWVSGVQPTSRPHRVLEMPDPILDLRAVQVDGDGVPDLLIRSRDEAILLRGRPHGGLGWGAGLAAEGLEIAGASVGDVDGDGDADVAFALVGGAAATLAVAVGDGAWSFGEDTDLRLELAFVPVDLSTGLIITEGGVEVALLTAESRLMRYRRMGEDWAELSPSSLDPNLAAPASFLGTSDINADGAGESVMVSVPGEGVERRVAFYTFEGTTADLNHKSYMDASFALQDLTGDSLLDVVALEGSDLSMIHFDAGSGATTFSVTTVGSVGVDRGDGATPVAGPIAVGLLDGDRLPDVLVVDQGLQLFPGAETEGVWAARDAAWSRYDLTLTGPPVLADLDAEVGFDTMAGWVDLFGVPVLRTWWVQPDEKGGLPELARRGELTFDEGDTPLGLVLVGGDVWGLILRGEATWLVRMVRGEGDNYVPGDSLAVTGEHLVAGAFADGGVVAVLTATGEGTVYTAGLAVAGVVSVGTFGCLAAGDSDGDGVDEVLSAADQGCSLLAVDLDGDGADEVATSVGDELIVAWGGEEVALEGSGSLGSTDLDGDGNPELLATTGGLTWIHRPLAGGFAPAYGLHGVGVLAAAPMVGDVTGDGIPDLVGYGADGMLWLAPGI